MIYHVLPDAYRAEQAERVARSLQRVLERDAPSAPGRVVPDDDSLVIGTCRALWLAVLFLDISSFSSRPSANHAEQQAMLGVLNVFFSEMVRVAADYGGTVEKNTGDGLMAYFQDDGGGATAAQKAVAAAMTMMSVNATAIAPAVSVFGASPLEFRVGIDYGPVTIARLGVARQFNANVAIGSTANIANKMLAEAQPGDILIGESVLQRLPDDWQRFAQSHGPSGFVYVATGSDYLLYRFTGRWG